MTAPSAEPAGDQAESLLAVGRLERVLDERLDAREAAERRVRLARERAAELRDAARTRGLEAADARRRELLEAAERDAAEMARATDADVAALRARAAAGRAAAVDEILALVLPREA